MVLGDRHECINRLAISYTFSIVWLHQNCSFAYKLIYSNSLCMQKEIVFGLQIVKLHGGVTSPMGQAGICILIHFQPIYALLLFNKSVK